MSLRRALPTVIVIAAATAVAACGGTSGDSSEAMPADTLIKPLAREPLTEADLAGIALTELALELPWTANRVTRDAAPGAPAAAIQGVDVVGHETFDRAMFLLDDTMAAPGYEIVLADAGTAVPCADGDRDLPARSLVVTFSPARASAGGGTAARTGMQATSATRMARAGVVCDDGVRVVWAAELTRGDQVRVLELRGPSRVAVDVR